MLTKTPEGVSYKSALQERGSPGFRDSFAAWLRWDSGFGYAASLVPLLVDSIGLVRRPAGARRVQPISVVINDPAIDAGSYIAAGLEGIDEQAFAFQRASQPFDEDWSRE
jgi:hypothetical protein